MKLPKNLQHFPKPTLVVTTDEQVARFWLAGGDGIEELDPVSMPREKASDREGAFYARTGYQHVGSDLSDAHDTPRKEQFAKAVGKRIDETVRTGHAEEIRMISPPEMLHRIEKRLGPESKKRIVSELKKDVMKSGTVDVIKRIFKKP
jgi:protein required for attachment to host cells